MRIAEGCPRSRVLLLSQCGHWVMVEHAALFNRMSIEFLQEPA
jgi:4,5:9,10-diseco-3-hydroxy-5,9,17-trioxoandrosta-1(10),2-diene-4-oate hydrolase